MILNWIGPVFGQSGYEVITRGMLFALDRLGVDIRLIPVDNWNKEQVSLRDDEKFRLYRLASRRPEIDAPVIMHQKMQAEAIQFKNKYCYTLFETDRIPQNWMVDLLAMTKVFTFSKFIGDRWIKNGFPASKLKILSFGLDKLKFENAKPMKVLNAKDFIFLTNGDYTERKNFEALIQAYVEEFSNQENITLIIKAHYKGFGRRHKNMLKEIIQKEIKKYNKKDIPQILFCGDKVAEDCMPAFYKGGNCFVLPTHGEGLGLPFIEAMYSGIPCIATRWGSQLDYMDDENSFLVGGKEQCINSIGYITQCPHALNHRWFEVDIEDLKRTMRSAFENKYILPIIGKNAKLTIQKYDWHYTAIEILREIFGGHK